MRRALALALLCALACRPFWLQVRDLPASVAVRRLELALRADGQGTLDLALEVTNPTSTPARLGELRFDLALDGRRFASGVQALSDEAPLGGHQTRWVAVQLPLALVAPPGAAAPRGVPASLTGELWLELDGVRRALPFRHRATLAGVPLPPPGPEPLD